MNQVCMICNYNERPMELSNLERLTSLLERQVDINAVQYPNSYNWHSNNKCKYNMSCMKTRNYETTFKRLTEKLNLLLTGYLEQVEDRKDYEVLRYLQGYFPSVYRQYEIDSRRNRNV